jgi:hypothetical protein
MRASLATKPRDALARQINAAVAGERLAPGYKVTVTAPPAKQRDECERADSWRRLHVAKIKNQCTRASFTSAGMHANSDMTPMM